MIMSKSSKFTISKCIKFCGCFIALVLAISMSIFQFAFFFEKRVEIMYSFSKEVEYSDMNMELLDEMMYSNFSAEDIINLL